MKSLVGFIAALLGTGFAIVLLCKLAALLGLIDRPGGRKDHDWPIPLVGGLAMPDVHLVSLKPELEGLIVPSKFYSSIAAGRPVIFHGSRDREFARFMGPNSPVGFCVDPADAPGLIRAIERLCDDPFESATFGRNGRQLFESRFDRPIALAKWSALMAELGDTSKSPVSLTCGAIRCTPRVLPSGRAIAPYAG